MMTLSKADLESAALEGTEVVVKLPKKHSKLLRLAVKDAMKLEKDPRYVLDMGTWHEPSVMRRDTCTVCMAGAVMACELKASPTSRVNPEAWERPSFYSDDYPDYSETAIALYEINAMRQGVFPSNTDRLKNMAFVRAGDLIKTHLNPGIGRAPWEIYLKAADILEKAGL